MGRSQTIRSFVLLLMMLATAGFGLALKPSINVGAPRARVDLESIIPRAFGDWAIDKRFVPIMPAPELEDKVNKIYDETLARTYVNANGQFVMLSIAYGGDQTGRLRVHRPESCYSAQGFQIEKVAENTITTDTTTIPVKRLMAHSGNRHEPITYWIRIGNSTVTSQLSQRFTQLRFGLTGEIPDGLIFRVSTIDTDRDKAFSLHNQFVSDLIRVLPKKAQTILIGAPDEARF